MDSKKHKYNNEELVFIKAKSEQCNGCRFAENDVVYNGKVLIFGSDKGVCKKYPEQKPLEIMNSKRTCSYKKV